jgi:transcription initiation factor TFIIH subunit 3
MQLLVFIRAYTLLNDTNQLAVFAVGSAGSTLLHATPDCAAYTALAAGAATLTGRGGGAAGLDAPEAVLQRLQQALAQQAASAAGDYESALSGALSRALCFVNKHQRAAPEGAAQPRPRVLCITACPDAPAQYIAVMNAIFAAQVPPPPAACHPPRCCRCCRCCCARARLTWWWSLYCSGPRLLWTPACWARRTRPSCSRPRT